jgi:glyoxylase-like metal-dependent hydrolase (beta-lactamase superfamily II)
MNVDDRFYFRQLLSGRDFAVRNGLAAQMVNYVYLLGDRVTRECVIVDPAYAVDELLGVIEADGMTLTGVLATHYHPDHIGGSMMGHRIDGIAHLLEKHNVPIHVNEAEAPWVIRTTEVDMSHLVAHSAGDTLAVGEIDITFVHTPGHTPGSQCFLARGCLISGDTLFLDGCGRTDLPGSDAEQMYDSLQTLAKLPDQTTVFPGHQYSAPPSAPMSTVRSSNYVYRTRDKDAWMEWFGPGR